MSNRKESIVHRDEGWGSGYRVTATHTGIEVFGFTGIMGISPVLIPWDQVDEARESVFTVKKKEVDK
jgi:hypothetical protein